MNLSKTRVVIVGAGQAVCRAAGYFVPIARAKNMAGEANDYDARPWFWCDQYDFNIQIVGHPGGGDEIVRGDFASGRSTTLSIRANEVVGGIAVNAARDVSVLRRLVAP